MTALFRDVGLGQDLDPAGDGRRQFAGYLEMLHHHPVNAIAHTGMGTHGFDVDIARTQMGRIANDGIHERDGRVFIDNPGILPATSLNCLQRCPDKRLAGDGGFDLACQHLLRCSAMRHIEWIAKGHQNFAVEHRQWDEAVLPTPGRRDLPQQLGLDAGNVRFDVGQSE